MKISHSCIVDLATTMHANATMRINHICPASNGNGVDCNIRRLATIADAVAKPIAKAICVATVVAAMALALAIAVFAAIAASWFVASTINANGSKEHKPNLYQH